MDALGPKDNTEGLPKFYISPVLVPPIPLSYSCHSVGPQIQYSIIWSLPNPLPLLFHERLATASFISLNIKAL